jgi:hypothetical protein
MFVLCFTKKYQRDRMQVNEQTHPHTQQDKYQHINMIMILPLGTFFKILLTMNRGKRFAPYVQL